MNYELMMRFLASLEMTGAPDEREGAVSGGAAAAERLFTHATRGVIPNGVRNPAAVIARRYPAGLQIRQDGVLSACLTVHLRLVINFY